MDLTIFQKLFPRLNDRGWRLPLDTDVMGMHAIMFGRGHKLHDLGEVFLCVEQLEAHAVVHQKSLQEKEEIIEDLTAQVEGLRIRLDNLEKGKSDDNSGRNA